MEIINKRVLLINISYEPITVINVARSILLIYKGKAQIIEHEEEIKLRSSGRFNPKTNKRENWEINCPTVLRLKKYVKVPRRNLLPVKSNICQRDRYICQYCGIELNFIDLTLDHVIPYSKGGKSTWENLVASCSRCNNKKGDRTPKQAGMKLLSKPKKPHAFQTLRFYIKTIRSPWKPYLFMESFPVENTVSQEDIAIVERSL